MAEVKRAELSEFLLAVQRAVREGVRRFEDESPGWKSGLAEVELRVGYRMERERDGAPLRVLVDLDEPERLLNGLRIPVGREE